MKVSAISSLVAGTRLPLLYWNTIPVSEYTFADECRTVKAPGGHPDAVARGKNSAGAAGAAAASGPGFPGAAVHCLTTAT